MRSFLAKSDSAFVLKTFPETKSQYVSPSLSQTNRLLGASALKAVDVRTPLYYANRAIFQARFS